MKTRLTIARRFARDRLERDLSNGAGHWSPDGWTAYLTADELDEVKSDAALYADGVDAAPLGVVLSARVTLARIAKAAGADQ